MKTNVIKITLLISIIFLSNGCKKENPSTPNTSTNNTPTGDYIRCKVNGELHTFELTQNGGNLNNYDNNYLGSPNKKIIQMARAEGMMDVFSIDLYKDLDSLVVPSKFTNVQTKKTPSIDFMLSYVKSFTYYTSIYKDSINGFSSITITSKSNDVIQGKFNGTFYGMNLNTSEQDSLKITDGEFRIKVTRKSLIP